ncbi:MAG TPA: hypothetical protein VFK73_05060 [Paludibacter sp.]|nr:hypothetical protein [Paludibacter sp.]
MKDIIITSARIKKEFIALLVCLLLGVLANTGAIIYYKTSFSEIITSFHYVLAFAVAMYLLWSVIRIVAILISGLLKKSKPTTPNRKS